jgi:hypothetical protein
MDAVCLCASLPNKYSGRRNQLWQPKALQVQAANANYTNSGVWHPRRKRKYLSTWIIDLQLSVDTIATNEKLFTYHFQRYHITNRAVAIAKFGR